MAQYSDPVSVLPGIGPKRAELLNKLNIYTVFDLISHFPRSYEDRTAIVEIAELEEGVPACFEAMVVSNPYTKLVRKGMEISHVTVADSSGRLSLTFFNQRYSVEKLCYGETYTFYGEIKGDYHGYGMVNPSFEAVGESGTSTRCIVPVYPLTAGISNKIMQRTILSALDACLYGLPDPLPPTVRANEGICDVQTAYRMIHAPKSSDEIRTARARLVFEEFFLFSLGLSTMRRMRSEIVRLPFLKLSLDEFYRLLPFSLTGAQQRAIEDIRSDLSLPRPMNRMVQGDVGSGKTMVAAAAAVLCAQNGQQTAFMVPTDILAEQHWKTLSRLLSPLGIRCALLTGSLSAAERRALLSQIAAGECDIIIGTHILFSASVEYRELGLVIADEQHRFGVAQRDTLQKKGEHPHLLVMSATPIPRTLALILYGDLDISVLDEKPAGRKDVLTYLVNEGMRKRINAFIRKQVSEGHRVFIVCPAVEDGEDSNMKSVEVWADTLRTAVFPEYRVLFLHGKMKGEDKDRIMTAFSSGEAEILVSTTVIEVGVDVPEATLMIVENADRFGLSQLHQLRGRVGRGDTQSYCVLFSDTKNPETLARLKALCNNTDGFKIAEEDLMLRGPGDFFGSRQSGLPLFRTAELSTDLSVLEKARKAADGFLSSPEEYPGLELLKRRVQGLFSESSESLN